MHRYRMENLRKKQRFQGGMASTLSKTRKEENKVWKMPIHWAKWRVADNLSLPEALRQMTYFAHPKNKDKSAAWWPVRVDNVTV